MPTIFLTIDEINATVTIRARLETEAGSAGPIGDLQDDVHPSETWLGLSYERLKEMGPGQHEIKA